MDCGTTVAGDGAGPLTRRVDASWLQPLPVVGAPEGVSLHAAWAAWQRGQHSAKPSLPPFSWSCHSAEPLAARTSLGKASIDMCPVVRLRGCERAPAPSWMGDNPHAVGTEKWGGGSR